MNSIPFHGIFHNKWRLLNSLFFIHTIYSVPIFSKMYIENIVIRITLCVRIECVVQWIRVRCMMHSHSYRASGDWIGVSWKREIIRCTWISNLKHSHTGWSRFGATSLHIHSINAIIQSIFFDDSRFFMVVGERWLGFFSIQAHLNSTLYFSGSFSRSLWLKSFFSHFLFVRALPLRICVVECMHVCVC